MDHLITKHALQGEDVLAWPRVAPFVCYAGTRVLLVRWSKVDLILVIWMRSGWNKKLSGFRMQAKIAEWIATG